ncbi:hypothetical protein SAMN04489713_104302 [Actinomadura madurae]|uniref:Uncharacterized protein n=1 Tax=Actinomadura madurae TaxID=1993 RepID=A0A1I5EVI1_9ACTN|nr:hypothetical protein [Actinomadura madurae]SFO15386.1 hypothetical protein SAMN04489713_104302 [Actinomadura madurae]
MYVMLARWVPAALVNLAICVRFAQESGNDPLPLVVAATIGGVISATVAVAALLTPSARRFFTQPGHHRAAVVPRRTNDPKTWERINVQRAAVSLTLVGTPRRQAADGGHGTALLIGGDQPGLFNGNHMKRETL